MGFIPAVIILSWLPAPPRPWTSLDKLENQARRHQRPGGRAGRHDMTPSCYFRAFLVYRDSFKKKGGAGVAAAQSAAKICKTYITMGRKILDSSLLPRIYFTVCKNLSPWGKSVTMGDLQGFQRARVPHPPAYRASPPCTTWTWPPTLNFSCPGPRGVICSWGCWCSAEAVLLKT